MKTKKLTSMLLLVAVLISGYHFQVSAGADSVWTYFHYDLLAKTGLSSMELDSNDRINVLYAVPVSGEDELRFASQTDTGWAIETVATVGNTSSFDLALDSNNNPHFVFRNRTTGTNNLGYYHKVGETWLYQDVTAQGTYPEDPILQIDQSGYPRMVVHMGGLSHYLFWDGVTWTDREIPNSGSSAWLALDSTGNPGIAFGDSDQDISYAEWNIDQWVIQEVDTNGVLGLYLSLAFDANDQPHIAYWEFQTGNLKYAHRTGPTEWAVSTVGGSGRFPTIVIDSAGNPHISSFSSISPTNLQYSYWTGSSWQIEQVTAFPDTTAGFLRLTKTDQPRILIGQYDNQNSEYLLQKILFKGSQLFIPLVIR